MDIVNEIIKNYFNSNLLTDKELVRTDYIEAPNSYKIGQYKDFKCGKFNLENVVNHFGFREVGWDEFPWGKGEKDAKNGALGVSTSNIDLFEWKVDQIFAINPLTKFWETTLLHEFGHLVLGHTLNNTDELQAEIEANLFAYFATQDIDFPNKDFSLIAASLKSLYELNKNHTKRGNYPNSQVKVMEKIAKGVVEIGCGVDKNLKDVILSK